MSTVFISHSYKDKPFVRKMASDLAASGIHAWVDEAEISVGDSLIDKISSAISEAEYVIVVLSKNSVQSAWVQKEIQIAMTHEIRGKSQVFLPVVIDDVDLPNFLKDKKYLDLRDPQEYKKGIRDLIGVISSEGRKERRPSDIVDIPDFAKEVAKEVAHILKISPEGIRLQNDPSPIVDPKLVFVIMSFAPDMEPIFDGIQAAGHSHGLKVERVKDVQGDYRIIDKVLQMIDDSIMVVADLTHEKPNVYFELGYVRGIQKTVITTAREGTKLHFDVKDWTCTFYNDSRILEKHLRERFEYELKRMGIAYQVR